MVNDADERIDGSMIRDRGSISVGKWSGVSESTLVRMHARASVRSYVCMRGECKSNHTSVQNPPCV